MKKARAIMIQGTGSGVGKSVITCALCRIFLQDGFSVAPFKAQNMALNSFVTEELGEIGRAQAVQALACRLEPSVDMNPVLIKPVTDIGAQIIVRGKPVGNMDALRYTGYKSRIFPVVRKSFGNLSGKYEVVVIEGAGSPAEVNLKPHDIVNMKMARYANAPVILTGDIDKGGVFASFVGTLELLDKRERKMIKGFLINKFRGDKTLLDPGIDFLEKRTGIKVIGVIPYFKDILIPEEDAVPLDNFMKEKRQKKKRELSINVICLPHMSNFTDFDALAAENDVSLRYVRRQEELDNPDIIIIPGTKSTIADLLWLKKSGLAGKILTAMRYPCLSGRQALSPVLIGICGGYQMLGKAIYDSHSIESNHKKIEGLNLLPVNTHLKAAKELARVKARGLSSGIELSGYEIHHGNTQIGSGCRPLIEVFQRNGRKTKYFDGAASANGRVLGTYIHGLFDTADFRRDFLNRVRSCKGWPLLPQAAAFNPDAEIDKLAKLVRQNLDMAYLYRVLKKEA